MSNQGHSNVGFRSLYESQNQRNHSQDEMDEMTRHTGENVRGFMPSMLLPTPLPNPESHAIQEANTKPTEGQTEELNRLQTEEVSLSPTRSSFLYDPPTKGSLLTTETIPPLLQIHRKQTEQLKKDPTLAVSLPGPSIPSLLHPRVRGTY
jgi:hypothetical protein